MRLIFYLFALSMLGNAANAQQNKKPDPLLPKGKQWTLDNYRNFFKQQHVNILQAAVLTQITKLLETPCTTVCLGSTLSVDGLTLKGERLNTALVDLKFSTLAENNNAGFVIQRRLENATSDFDSVGFVKSVGNSFGKTEYAYQDFNSFERYSFYRLKQVDIDGGYKFSAIIKVDGYAAPLSLKVIPNPATSENISIQLKGFKNYDHIAILISDSKGSTVYNKQATLSQTTYRLQDIHLLSGVYYIKVFNSEESAFTSFIIR